MSGNVLTSTALRAANDVKNIVNGMNSRRNVANNAIRISGSISRCADALDSALSAVGIPEEGTTAYDAVKTIRVTAVRLRMAAGNLRPADTVEMRLSAIRGELRSSALWLENAAAALSAEKEET